MDHQAKEQVKATLLERLRRDLAASQANLRTLHDAAEVDPDSSSSVDDLSQSDSSGDLTGIFEKSTAAQESEVARVEALDFGPKDTITPGAIVGFDGSRFVVGVVADEFDCDGTTYEGISADAPIFDAIYGLRVGDQFSFRGREHTIDFVA